MPLNCIKITDKYILFKIIYQNDNINSVKLEIKKYCDYLTNMIENLNKDINIINTNLNIFIENQVKDRKEKLTEENKFLDEVDAFLSNPKDL